MEFRIADTFTASLARLSGPEQTAAKTTAFDLQANPANPGLQFHRIDKTKDKNFWSIRVNRDIRIIVHKTESSFLLCYVDHHDDAYTWAERRKIEVHPQTGAAQLVEVRETVKEIIVPTYVHTQQPAQPKLPLFVNRADEELLGYGIPAEWLSDVRNVVDEDALLRLVDHLPAEAADALLILADGKTPPEPAVVHAAPFEHPDAMRRFRVVDNVDELRMALEYPWEKWAVFLHPAQRVLVEGSYDGPVRVAGSAGTGKTVVALHRAIWLVENNPGSRLLLTTFSKKLANALQRKLKVLLTSKPRLTEQIDVYSMDSLAERLYGLRFGKARIASKDDIREILRSSSDEEDHAVPIAHLISEWEKIVDAWQVTSWESYRDFPRLGRKTRASEKQLKASWAIFERTRVELSQRQLRTEAEMLDALASEFELSGKSPFDFAVVDEAQDINPAQLKFLKALCGNKPDGLFFVGDMGQRIFQEAFSWRAAGVDVRERSHTLKINYRTSHQIRSQADRLLAPEVSDVDGVTDERRGTISVFNGPEPKIKVYTTTDEEIDGVAEWLFALKEQDVKPHEIGIFVRSGDELERATKAVERAGLETKVLDTQVEPVHGHVSVGTMHLAKGLEFRAVAVMACEDEIVPSQKRIETVSDDSDLQEVYDTERHLLYVACTRARDYLLLTAAENPSEFLEDLKRERLVIPEERD